MLSRLAPRLVPLLAVAVCSVATAQTPVWRVRLHVQKTAAAEEKVHTEPVPFDPGQSVWENLDLKVEFDVSRDLQVVSDSVKARYNWSLKARTYFIGKLAALADGNESGTRLEGPDGTPGLEIFWRRELDPQPCEPSLRVYDDEVMAEMARMGLPAPVPKNLLTMEFKAIWPGKVDSVEYLVGSEESGKETYPTEQERLEIPYKAEAGRWEGDLDLPSPVGSVRVSCQIERKNVDFSVEQRWNKWDYRAKAILKIDGKDCASEFKFRRWRRQWEADIDARKIDVYEYPTEPGYGSKVAMGNHPRVGDWRLVEDWIEEKDNIEAEGPIQMIVFPPAGDPGLWPWRRYLVEYLVAVDGFPELGYVYHWSIKQSSDYHYDGYLYESVHVQPDEWCKVKAEKRPTGDIYVGKVTQNHQATSAKPLR